MTPQTSFFMFIIRTPQQYLRMNHDQSKYPKQQDNSFLLLV